MGLKLRATFADGRGMSVADSAGNMRHAPGGARRRHTAGPATRRVLVVDDNPDVGADMARVLTQRGHRSPLDSIRTEMFGDALPTPQAIAFEVDIAHQGQDAEPIARAAFDAGDPYALAFVDMRMPPGWNGVETIAHLWAIDPAMHVVIYTAYSDFRWDDVIAQLGRSEGLHLLRKPLRPAHVIRVAEVLTTKWLRRRGADAR